MCEGFVRPHAVPVSHTANVTLGTRLTHSWRRTTRPDQHSCCTFQLAAMGPWRHARSKYCSICACGFNASPNLDRDIDLETQHRAVATRSPPRRLLIQHPLQDLLAAEGEGLVNAEALSVAFKISFNSRRAALSEPTLFSESAHHNHG